jgi:hypothetical protein
MGHIQDITLWVLGQTHSIQTHPIKITPTMDQP